MKLIAVTYGTEGDTRPTAALCRGLIDAGHGVRLLADASTLAFADSLGIPTTPLAGDIQHVARTTAMPDLPQAFGALVNKHTDEWFDTILSEAKGCDAILISGLAAFVGLSAADALKITPIGTMLIPITPTRDFTAPFIPFALPRWLNSWSHWLVNQLVWFMFRSSTNAARAKHGLPARGSVWSGHPMLYGVSPALVPRPIDYPANAFHTGQWVPPRDSWSPPADLVAFLEAGEKPAYVGFGSMAGLDTAPLLAAIVGALGDRRALFYKGWSTVDTAGLPPNIFLVGPTPHDWLLPQCAMAIHHGGSGTTHSACAAGIPSIILYFAGDQAFWAQRMVDLGIAADVLSGLKVTRDQLFAATVFADRPDVQEKAKALGEAMREEHGVKTAIELVEEMVRA